MGNLFSFFSNYDHEEDILENEDDIDFAEFDTFDKTQLVDYIKQLKVRGVEIPEDFEEKMKNVEIENSNLIPMCVELYKKMYIQFGEYKPPAGKAIRKKLYYVRPKFGIDKVKENIAIPIHNIGSILDTNLMIIPQSVVAMKEDDISYDEFMNSFNNNIAKKDMMGISKNILKNVPKYIKIRLINTFNQILSDLTKVDNISFGKGSYIYKANKHGPTNDINSFRLVISIPNSVNQFHRILVLRLNNYLLFNKYVDTSIQKGGISGQKFAIFEQFYKVKNVIKNANRTKKSCAVLFLDISNAFGNVNLQNMYKILEAYHVNKKIISYIEEFYKRFEYYVDMNSEKTGLAKWNNGLIQGCALSPLLFILCLNYVLTHLDKEYKEGFGYDFDGKTRVLFTAFMDDICIMCKDVAALEIVYKKLVELFKVLGLPINKDKCAIMMINDNTNTHWDFDQIQKVNVFKYLGEYISIDGSSTESYIQFLKYLNRKLKLVDGKPIANSEKMKLFEGLVVPWIQRKTMAMYDISMTKRFKIISIIKPYLEKWGHSGMINIFSNITPIIQDSKDDVISGIKFDETDIDMELEKSIELSNYVLKDSSIKLSYDQIDDDFKIETELEEYIDV